MTEQVVVDSCVSVKWLVHEQDSQRAIELLSSESELIAPDIVLVETVNALWKNVRRGLLAPDRAQARLGDLPRFFDRLLPTTDFVMEAFTFAQAIDVPIYDCVYVVAARRTGASLVTADRKLIAKLAGTPEADKLVHISDWS